MILEIAIVYHKALPSDVLGPYFSQNGGVSQICYCYYYCYYYYYYYLIA